MPPFDPLFRNPHLQTILGHYWKRTDDDSRFPIERRLYRTEPDVQVLVESQRPDGRPEGEIVMVHGLEGSGRAVYIGSLAGATLSAGSRCIDSTCGRAAGPNSFARHFTTPGLTSDLLTVVRELKSEGEGPIFLVGFSLGGNVVVKLGSELGETRA